MERRQRFNKMELVAGMLALGLLTLLATVACEPHHHHGMGNMTKASSNCRQIVMALKLYASDHDGKYPDAHIEGTKTANTVFRKLFDKEIVDNEIIFGAPLSPFQPDGVIEDSYLGPESTRFKKAVQSGENHWAMTEGVTDSMPASIPLVYENPVSATWPPKWNPNAKGTATRGRSWSNGIVVGMNDGSAHAMPLVSKKGKEVRLKSDPATGKDVFEAAIDPVVFPVGKVLDVE